MERTPTPRSLKLLTENDIESMGKCSSLSNYS